MMIYNKSIQHMKNATTPSFRKGTIYMALLILIGTGQWSCSNDDTFNQSNPPNSNQPPTAIAGPDQQIFLPLNSTYLVGSSSTDPDNNIIASQVPFEV